MKITKRQLIKIIKEELEEPRGAWTRANASCYLVYAGGSSDPFIRYASGSLGDVRNFLWGAKSAGENVNKFSVMQVAGDQLAGGVERDITQEVLEEVLAIK